MIGTRLARESEGINMAHQHTQKKTHHHRDDLTGEHKVSDTGQIVLACLCAAT